VLHDKLAVVCLADPRAVFREAPTTNHGHGDPVTMVLEEESSSKERIGKRHFSLVITID